MNDETTTTTPTEPQQEAPPQTEEEQRAWLAKTAERLRAQLILEHGPAKFKMATLPMRQVLQRCKEAIPSAGGTAIGVLQAFASLGIAMGLDQGYRQMLLAASHDETYAEQKPRLVVVVPASAMPKSPPFVK